MLFRMGDFYEVFYEDAKICARVLGIALTSREKGEDAVPMAGFPQHAASNYIKRLIQGGHRVAVCEQVQDPSEASGLVERDVTRVITAGTLTEENILEQKANNFLAAVNRTDSTCGMAWVDLSTGTFEIEEVDDTRIEDSISRIGPTECLLPEQEHGEESDDGVSHFLPEECVVTRRPPWEFAEDEGRRTLKEHFETGTLDGFGCEGYGPAIGAAGAILAYLQETHRSALGHINKLEPFVGDRYLVLDSTTQRSLELLQTMRDGGQHGSLLGVLDKTHTPMGGRLIRRWISTPLNDAEAIDRRLDAVEELVGSKLFRQNLRERLKNVYDIERLATKIYCSRANARDMVSLENSLEELPELKETLKDCESDLLCELRDNLDTVPEVAGLINTAIVSDPPVALTEGGIIRDGYNPELDELRQKSRKGKNWIAEFEKEESERSEIPSLKVGFNKVFGYYIEVTNTHKDKVPEHYIRKQTLKNSERYITPELKEWESMVLGAGERAEELEYDLFQEVREKVSGYTTRLQATADRLAILDVLLALATVAAERGYVRPKVSDDRKLDIEEGRHPVLEQIMDDEFVPNGVELDGDESQLLIITGPNMSGKSVYIRQTALLVLMAQMGSFIPAREAEVGTVDRIFTRVGASDEQRRGLSTFMTEMVEVANILNNASDRSLIILDEVGRGTSTFDGVSIAWATAEFIHDEVGARTLFATHYHELSQLADMLGGVRNFNVAVKEWQGKVIFLHRITPGSTDRSYGIHVARLAGVPDEVVDRSREILSKLEENSVDIDENPSLVPDRKRSSPSGVRQMPLFKPLDAEIRDEIVNLDTSSMTPLDALNKLDQIKRRLSGEDEESEE